MERVYVTARNATSLVVIAAGAFFLASGFASLATLPLIGVEPSTAQLAPLPAGQGPPPRLAVSRSGREVCDLNVFDASRRPCEAPVTPPPGGGGAGEPRRCDRTVKLVGTVASTESSGSLAVIRRGDETRTLAIGEAMDGLGRIERIGWRLVLVERDDGGGCLLDIYPPAEGDGQGSTSPPPGSATTASSAPDELASRIEVISPTERRLPRSFIEDVLNSPGRFLSPRMGRASVVTEGGQMRGFRIAGVRRGGLLERLGVRNGDVISAVNGLEMSTLDRPIEALTAFRRSGSISVSVTRRGRPAVLRFDID